MNHLLELYLDGTAIKELPESIKHLTGLMLLDLTDCTKLLKLPDVICNLTSLKALEISGCSQLDQLPESIGSMEQLEELDASRTAIRKAPSSIILLKNLRSLSFAECSGLAYRSWKSLGFTFIHCDDREEAADVGCPANQDNIFNGEKPLTLGFTCTRIPKWCSHQTDGSSIGIQLPLEDRDKTWVGFALFVVFVIQEDGNFHKNQSLEKALCHFGSDKGCLWNEFVRMDHLRNSGIRSYGVCIYIPRMSFEEQLNEATQVAASISTNKPYIKANMCGMHIVFNEDVLEFSRNLTQIMMENFYFKSKGKGKPIKEIKVEPCSSAGAMEIQPNPHKQIKREDCRSTESDSTRKARKDLHWLVLMLVERCNACNHGFVFQFPLKTIPTWFFHQSVAPFVVCYLPRNLLNEKPCLGFFLYANLTWRPSVSHSNYLDPAFLYIRLQAYGDGEPIIYSLPIEHELVMFNAPLAHFIPQLNQCRLVSALFRTSIPDWEVEMCGIGLLYEKDLGNILEMITDHTLSSYHFCYQECGGSVEDSSGAVECSKHLRMKVELPFDLHAAKREKKSLQELLSNTQLVQKISVSLKQNVGRCCSESSYEVIPESTLKDSRPRFINLQIMAENAFYVHDLTKWKRGLEDLLKQLFGFDIFIALILDGHIISLVKPFNPFSSYNLIFPRKEILDWFGSDCHISKRSVKIELPPNLNGDENWKGLAVCTAVSVHEHPTAIIDRMTSEISFGLQCHLDTEEHCYHPPQFGITKDKLTWLYLRGFIWLTYIPSSVLTDLKIEQNYLEIRTTSEFPGVVTNDIGARLLYQQDVEEFAEAIAKCTTSFFDNLDPVLKAMASDEGESCNCLFHFHVGCSLHHLEEIATHCGFGANEAEILSDAVKAETFEEDGNSYLVTQQENLTEPIYQRKSGLDFDRGIPYSSCFPPTDILDWFNHHSNGPSLTIQLSSNLCSDDNWIGLALCSYFADPEHPTTFFGNFDLEILGHYLVCYLETERAGLDPLHQHEITNEEFKKLDSGEFIWLSYIPRLWFSDQLKDCNLIEASFASERGGWRSQRCGLRLLYRHDEEEFKQTLNHCMASLIDNQDPISHTKFDNERNKKQRHDGQAGTSKSVIYISDPEQENLEGPNNLNQKDRGKRILQ
ncbi:hypothetical protein FEM48_Zijuj10G0168600 [Ziziphus jujuba var. spinosa]|uniref:Disease resistance-like protein DSC1 n=1 Tax=Ziziphus jujuba var. spinosa TaxID=714518 RepID=A0A978UPK4_ZIZJJ|nr:hypothetical protein FEM48_Zijuj10G0168600 [Ziziphus jujuba var. spinosa]